MINTKEIKNEVQKYINQEQNGDFINHYLSNNNHDQFLINTVKRLIIINEKFKNNNIYFYDFILSLRNYLITFNTELIIKNIDINQNNSFGIIKNGDKISASYAFPENLSENANGFIEDAFNTFYNFKNESQEEQNLQTDSFIYELTGYTKYKTMSQKLAVTGSFYVPEGNTCLISLPTGGGKSLITQSLAYYSDGLTIVIIPTVSLAIDQVRAAKQSIRRKNIDNEIFQYTSKENAIPIINAIKNKTARLLFISPETLMQNSLFKETISEANKHHYLKNIIIDEAHIAVEWGESFRVEYQCLEAWRNNLLIDNKKIRTYLLSATYEIKEVKILKNIFSSEDRWMEIRCDSLRREPRYIFTKSRSNKSKEKTFIELVKKLPHPMIIYVINPDDANRLKRLLNCEGINNVRTFTGKTTAEDRKAIIEDWINNNFSIMVATNAFGVGVDKSDVRSVIHMYVPQTPNSYYQELGRGGRDGLPSLSVINIIENDIGIMRNRINKLVLTSDKIVGRWISMINSQKTKRNMQNIYTIDTSQKPNYIETFDISEDKQVNDMNLNWNIYVLLLLRRYNLIKIIDVIYGENTYIFMINIINKKLVNNDDELKKLVTEIREKESQEKNKAFNSVVRSIRNKEEECWSEMFYDTYNYVYECCSGCPNHKKPINYDDGFPLKKIVSNEINRKLPISLSNYFKQKKELLILYKNNNIGETIDLIVGKNQATLIDCTNNFCNYNIKSRLTIFSNQDFVNLLNKRDRYFLSGLVIVLLDDNETFSKFSGVKNKIYNNGNISTIYLLENDIFIEKTEKYISDYIDGSTKTSEEL